MQLSNPTGLIVEVRPKNQDGVEFEKGISSCKLIGDDYFIGYCWQIMNEAAYIHEAILIDNESKMFRYGEEAIFPLDKVIITIKALRGPNSNNRFILPKELRTYETWNPIGLS